MVWRFGVLITIVGILTACTTNTTNKHTHTNHGENKFTLHSYYSCPQHPEIKQYNPGLCSICKTDMIKAGGLVWENKTDEELVFLVK